MPDLVTGALAMGSGGIVWLVLGLVGGGASILAAPLSSSLVGTSAVAVSASALGTLLTRWRPGNMEGRCAAVRDGRGARRLRRIGGDEILAAHEIFRFDRFLIQMAMGVRDHVKLMKTIEIFGTRVAPEVRKALRS